MHTVAWALQIGILARIAAALQCPTGLPGGSKYLLCIAGSGNPGSQADPYPIQLGKPGLDFLSSKAGIYGTDNVRLFRCIHKVSQLLSTATLAWGMCVDIQLCKQTA